jgi:uncharacterized protein DUF6610
MVLKIVIHGRDVQRLAATYGWGNGARYTNLRDIREHHPIAFIDIDWKNYSFDLHLKAVKRVQPFITVMKDIEEENDFTKVVSRSKLFFEWTEYVILVPKFKAWKAKFERHLTERHIIGYSVPTRYGSTTIGLSKIDHPVHLLGGRPDRQRDLGLMGNVVSIDCNRFTLDAAFGDYFDGVKYNYERCLSYQECLARSIQGIDFAWSSYIPSNEAKMFLSHWNKFRWKRKFTKAIADASRNIQSLVFFS